MNINKQSLNKRIIETLDDRYGIEKLLKTMAKEKGVDPGYHVVFTAANNEEQSILTKKTLGVNLQEAATKLDAWLAENPEHIAQPPAEKLTYEQRKTRRARKALDFLCATFPKCFVPLRSPKPVRAFAIGIFDVLIAQVENKLPDDIHINDIKRGMVKYTSLRRYHYAIGKIGNPRINLDGEVVGKVTKKELAIFYEMKKARKAARAKKAEKAKKAEAKKAAKTLKKNAQESQQKTSPPPALKLEKKAEAPQPSIEKRPILKLRSKTKK